MLAISLCIGSNASNITLQPGIYSSITITGTAAGTVTFSLGTYILCGGNANNHALYISTNATVIGSGVLFYNTGSNYDAPSATPDASDGNTLGTDTGSTFGDIYLKAGKFQLTPLSDTSNPFDGLLFYQRRWNTRSVTIDGQNSHDLLDGTVYALRAKCSLSGAETTTASFSLEAWPHCQIKPTRH